jgi:hypothetical protein
MGFQACQVYLTCGIEMKPDRQAQELGNAAGYMWTSPSPLSNDLETSWTLKDELCTIDKIVKPSSKMLLRPMLGSSWTRSNGGVSARILDVGKR